MEQQESSAIDLIGQELARVRPSARQLAWQDLEFYAFVHFGMNTMTDREWGLGHEDPALFDPTDLDVDQWMRAIASAGMTGVILTAKHHDGFCLWPSATTRHTVAASPWGRDGADLVGEVADSARAHGLRFGVYLSPWDRTDATYGSGTPYDDLFVAQLEELLTGYGDIFTVWFDGANGEGPSGRRQEYDWERYYAVVRRLQPGAVINVCGPDVRWCGNEAGSTRADEWSVVPAVLQEVERIADASQKVDDGRFSRAVSSEQDDLGSRPALAGFEDDLVWYPAEVNTSIRPGWFHHDSEDGAVRTVGELFDIWASSVGGNACFLLNVPPDRRGRVAEPDVQVLAQLGERIAAFKSGVIPGTVAVSSGTVDAVSLTRPFPPGRVSWAPEPGDPEPHVRIELPERTLAGAVVLGEDIAEGQRIEDVTVTGWRGGEAHELGRCNAVGRLRILRFAPTEVDAVTITVRAARDAPKVSAAAVIAGPTAPR